VSAVGVYYLGKKSSEKEKEERKPIPLTDDSGIKEEEPDDEVFPSVEESVAEEEDLSKPSTDVEENDMTRLSTADSGTHKEDDAVALPLSEAIVAKEAPGDMTKSDYFVDRRNNNRQRGRERCEDAVDR